MKERKKRKKRGEAVATASPSQNGEKVVWSLSPLLLFHLGIVQDRIAWRDGDTLNDTRIHEIAIKI